VQKNLTLAIDEDMLRAARFRELVKNSRAEVGPIT
jgi:hypothetical protein